MYNDQSLNMSEVVENVTTEIDKAIDNKQMSRKDFMKKGFLFGFAAMLGLKMNPLKVEAAVTDNLSQSGNESSNQVVKFDSKDDANPSTYTDVDVITSDQKQKKIFSSITVVTKNTRYLWSLLKSPNLATVLGINQADKSIPGAVKTINTNKVGLPMNGTNAVYGSNGQYARSDANGGITWQSGIVLGTSATTDTSKVGALWYE